MNGQPVVSSMERQKGQESLREALDRLGKPLLHQLEEVWRRAEEGIHDAQRSKDGHQQGTPHCRAVEENLAALIPDDWKGTQFTATDLFVLSAAAALHDTGKAYESSTNHGLVSMQEVCNRYEAFGLDIGQSEVVGLIVRPHSDGNLNALPANPLMLGIAEVNVRQLAALFKLADMLHSDYRRVSRQVIEFGGRQAEDNKKTRFRSLVRGWRFGDQDQIVLLAVPKNADDIRVIYTGFEMMCQELEPVVSELKQAGLPCRLDIDLASIYMTTETIQEASTHLRKSSQWQQVMVVPTDEKPKVFIGSKMAELRKVREIVRDTLQTREFEVFVSEEEGALYPAASTFLVKEADFYVGLFGEKYDQVAMEEYRYAYSSGKPCFVYIQDTDSPREQELEAFITQIKDLAKEVLCRHFDDVSQIGVIIFNDVISCLTRDYRRLLAQTQAREDSWRKLEEITETMHSIMRDPQSWRNTGE